MAWLDMVAEKVKEISYGMVQIFVRNSRVVQIECVEHTRFEVTGKGSDR